MLYEQRVGVDRTDGQVFPEQFQAVYQGRRFYLYVTEIVSLAWLRPAPTLAGHSQKANSTGMRLCAHITSRGLHWTMAEYSTGPRCTRSPAWKSARGMDRSKCGAHLLRGTSSERVMNEFTRYESNRFHLIGSRKTQLLVSRFARLSASSIPPICFAVSFQDNWCMSFL
jgi:hypothetical protein